MSARRQPKPKRSFGAYGRVPHPTPFGTLLYACITTLGISANQFARRVGMSSGFVSGVYSGLKKPPLEFIEKWAKTLKLTGAKKETFIYMAHLQHATPLLRQAFSGYRELAIEALHAGLDTRGADLRAVIAAG